MLSKKEKYIPAIIADIICEKSLNQDELKSESEISVYLNTSNNSIDNSRFKVLKRAPKGTMLKKGEKNAQKRKLSLKKSAKKREFTKKEFKKK